MGDLGRRARRRLLLWLGRLLSIRDTPEAMARGLAVGFFFGVSFLWGLQILLAVLVAHFVRGNKVLAGALTAVSNPLTSLPLYGLCYWLGQLVVGGNAKLPNLAQLNSVHSILALGPQFFLAMFVGSTIIGLIGAVVLYFSANQVFAGLRRWHAKRALAVNVLDPAPRLLDGSPGRGREERGEVA